MLSETFATNLALLAEKMPALSVQLRWMKPSGAPTFFERELPNSELLYSLGLIDPRKALEWLKDGQHLVMIEEDPQALADFLHTSDATPFLEHEGGHLALANQTLHLFSEFADLEAKVVGEGPLGDQLLRGNAEGAQILDEFRHGGNLFYQNCYANFRRLPDSYRAASLFGKFKNVPAIISGAGPSLDKNGEILKEVGNRALIFAGGSSMNALNALGVQPHFGAGCDPHWPQFQRLMTNTAWEVPFFYNSRWCKEALPLINAPKLYLNGTSCYPVCDWMEEELGIEGSHLSGGHNVVNLTMEIAAAMGCNPIIFVGLDLAFTNDLTYADGIVPDRTDIEDELQHPGIDGTLVRTQFKWLTEAKWISEFAQAHPENRFLNATEGGLGFEGISNVSLKEALKECKQEHTFDLSAKKFSVTDGQVVAKLEELKASLDRAIEKLHRLCNKYTVLDEVELEEEIAYTLILEEIRKLKKLDVDFPFLLKVAQENRERLQEALYEKPQLGEAHTEVSKEEVRLYFPDGHLKRLISLRKGIRHGVEKLWHENHQLILEAEFDHGKLVNRSRRWHPNGVLAEEITYHEDGFTKRGWDEQGESFQQEEYLQLPHQG